MKKLLLATALALVPFSASGLEPIEIVVAKLIRAYGFDCPAIAGSQRYGNDHRGTVVKVWCGQDDNNGRHIYFRVMQDANNIPGMNFPNVTVVPWQD